MRTTLVFLVVLSVAAIGAAAVEPAQPNVLLIVLDTVRFDAISASNTPFLASLMPRSVVFKAAYSTHDFTPPSHFSLMTGFYDGLDSTDDRVENSVPFQLHRAHYQTFGAAANGIIRPAMMPTFRAFDRFFEVPEKVAFEGELLQTVLDIDARLAMYHCRRTHRSEAILYYSADRILDTFLGQIRTAHAPYFGFLNLLDAHEPYVPNPADYPPERTLPAGFSGDVLTRPLGAELRAPDDIADPARRQYVKAKIGEAGSKSQVAIDLSPDALAIYRRRYQATVREIDATLRQFFEVLNREKRLENTYVIITSDHGESFGEADLITHSFDDRGNYESTHHVPLMIVLPDGSPGKPRIVNRKVSIANVAPTIYDLTRMDASALRVRYKSYPKSLLPLFMTVTPKAVATVKLPSGSAKPDATAARAREALLRSLGYLQ